MTKKKKKNLKRKGNYPYSLRFNTRAHKYNLIVTDNEIIQISSEDHRGYAGGIVWKKKGFQRTPLIEHLEEMLKEKIDSKAAEAKIKNFYKKELAKIKPIWSITLKDGLNTKLKTYSESKASLFLSADSKCNNFCKKIEDTGVYFVWE